MARSLFAFLFSWSGRRTLPASSPPRQQRRGLRHEPDQLVSSGSGDALAVDRDTTFVGSQEPGHDLQQCRFSAAARSDDRDELAAGDREAYSVENEHAIVARAE